MQKQNNYEIIDLNSEGEGVANFQGKITFVEGALEQEIVRAKVVVEKKKYDRAVTVEILKESHFRRKTPCPYFGKCGGCQIMHANREGQLAYKTKKVQLALKKFAHLDVLVNECIASPKEWNYRNKIQLPVGQGVMGLYRKASNEIIPIERCLIQKKLGEEILDWIKQYSFSLARFVLIRTSDFEDKALVALIHSGKKQEILELGKKIFTHEKVKGVVSVVNERTDSVILTEKVELLFGEAFLEERILSKRFFFGTLSFFQVNPEQAEHLFAKAIALANIQKTESVLDAYCGVGVLAILAAEKAKKIWGFEVSFEAISFAKKNAEINEVTNLEFMQGKAEELIDHLEQIDHIFINPPRKGCEQSLLEKIKRRGIKNIIYISCDPATLARDLKLLDSYVVKEVQPFDMFPQTTHVETIVKLLKM